MSSTFARSSWVVLTLAKATFRLQSMTDAEE